MKSHGPAFRKARIELMECPACQGRAVVLGVFHDLACDHCNASGWLDMHGHALPLEELVIQLSLRLQLAELQLAEFRRRGHGPAAQYEQNNRLGAGGTNYTGD